MTTFLATVTDGTRTDYALMRMEDGELSGASLEVRRAIDLMATDGVPFRAIRYHVSELDTWFAPDFPAIGASRLPQPGYAVELSN